MQKWDLVCTAHALGPRVGEVNGPVLLQQKIWRRPGEHKA